MYIIYIYIHIYLFIYIYIYTYTHVYTIYRYPSWLDKSDCRACGPLEGAAVDGMPENVLAKQAVEVSVLR